MTKERKNHDLAWQYFVEIGKIPSDARKNEYCLHHNCPALKYINPRRYHEWHVDDLTVMTRSEHAKFHSTGYRNSGYGKKFSEERKKHLRENHADKSGEKNGMYGKHHSDEAKKKMSEKAKLRTGEKNGMYGKPGATRGKHWKLVNGKRVYYDAA